MGRSVNQPMDMPPYDLVGNIMAFESGELTDAEVITLFSVLIKSGQAWSLQGMYGRAAQGLIDAGLITQDDLALINERMSA